MTVEGEARPLPPGADLTAYRIVQEALTNVTKHSGGATATVRLGYSRRLLTLTVSDDGHAPPTTGTPGYGLIGMRERALSAGGRLAAGHRADGGFEVTTELPLESRETAEPGLHGNDHRDGRDHGNDHGDNRGYDHGDDEERTAR